MWIFFTDVFWGILLPHRCSISVEWREITRFTCVKMYETNSVSSSKSLANYVNFFAENILCIKLKADDSDVFYMLNGTGGYDERGNREQGDCFGWLAVGDIFGLSTSVNQKKKICGCLHHIPSDEDKYFHSTSPGYLIPAIERLN